MCQYQLPTDVLIIIANFTELKYLNNFKISTTWINILDKILQQKFNIYSNEKKLIVNVKSKIVVNTIKRYKRSNGIEFNNKSKLLILSTHNIMECYFFCGTSNKSFSDFKNICDVDSTLYYGIPYKKNTINLS